jgi:hypothetical protein
MPGMSLTDQQELDAVEATIVALVDGTQPEQFTIGEETTQLVRFIDLHTRRETLLARGATSTVVTDAELIAKLDTRISELTSGDDAVSVTIGEETVRGPSLKVLQQAQKTIENRVPAETAAAGNAFSYYERPAYTDDYGSSSFPVVEFDYTGL